MSGEIRRADWTIPYPADLADRCVSTVLEPLTHVAHEWEDFPWHLTGRLVALLEKPEASFEYFHLTAFFRARAAMLALSGKILDRGELLATLRRHQVQAGGAYRQHLLGYLHRFLATHSFAKLPECEIRKFEGYHSLDAARRHREHVQGVLGFAETDYIDMLNFISMTASMDDEVCGHSVGFWVKGAEMPNPLDVRVQVRRHDAGYDLLPVRDEAKSLIQAGRPPKKIMVRTQREFEFVATTGGEGISDLKSPISEKGQGQGRTKAPAHGLKVIGDYRLIMAPGRREPISMADRPKARQFLRFVHERLMKNGETDFYVEEMREAFNEQFPDDMAQRRWVSDRFREDLFRGKEREFDVLFERLDKGAGRYRMKVCGVEGAGVSRRMRGKSNK